MRASERLMAALGRPAPDRSVEQEAAYREAMDLADRELAELIARRNDHAA
jgi:hypothetical protein